MIFRFTLSLFLFFQLIANAQTAQTIKLSYNETLATIDRLTHGTNQIIRRTYQDKVLFSEEWHQENLTYVRFYYRDGNLASEGLMLESVKVGHWNYYAPNGIKLKTSDYGTLKSTWFGETPEPYDALLQNTLAIADSFIIDKFGASFVQQFVHYSGATSYFSKKVLENPENKDFLEIQEDEPVMFIFVYSIVFNDTLIYHRIALEITPEGEIQCDERDIPNCMATDNQTSKIIIDLNQANKLATNWGFPLKLHQLSVKTDGFYWVYSDYFSDSKQNWAKQLQINANTGIADTTTLKVDYNRSLVLNAVSPEDTIKPKSGFKKINYQGLLMDIPAYWIELEEYKKLTPYSSTFTYFGQGDTIHFYTTYDDQTDNNYEAVDSENVPTYFQLTTLEHEPCQAPAANDISAKSAYENCLDERRKNQDKKLRAYELYLTKEIQYNDSLGLLSMINKYQTQSAGQRKAQGNKIASEFKSYFPNGKMHDRNFDLEVVVPFDGKGWDLHLKIYNVYNLSITYHFVAKNLTDARFQRIFETLKTIRFIY